MYMKLVALRKNNRHFIKLILKIQIRSRTSFPYDLASHEFELCLKKNLFLNFMTMVFIC